MPVRAKLVHARGMRLSPPRADISLLTDDPSGLCLRYTRAHTEGGGGRVRVMYVREKYGYEMNGSDQNGLDARLRFSLSADIDTSSSPIA